MLITEPNEVRETIEWVAENKACLFAPCTESEVEMYAIGATANAVRKRNGSKKFVLMVGATSAYKDRPQFKLIGEGDISKGYKRWHGWLEGTFGKNGIFDNIDVIPYLDHAMPSVVIPNLGQKPSFYPGEFGTLDDKLLNDEQVLKKFGVAMFDCSYLPIDENIKLTAEYVSKYGNLVLVEGAPEHIEETYQSNESIKDRLSKPEDVKRFFDETGVYLVVPFVGTEHRTTVRKDDKQHYYGDRVREIRELVGRRIALHGCSCLDPDKELTQVADDGIVKLNFYTAMAVAGGQAMAMYVFDEIMNIGGDALNQYCRLHHCDSQDRKPQLHFVAPAMRNNIHAEAVMMALGYDPNKPLEPFDPKNPEKGQVTIFDRLHYERLK